MNNHSGNFPGFATLVKIALKVVHLRVKYAQKEPILKQVINSVQISDFLP